MSKQPRRYDGRTGVRLRTEWLGMLKMQAHCNEFFRSRNMPLNECCSSEFKSRKERS